jgi:hypothetical protein
MTDFVVRCPNCTQGARVPFEARGQLVECPRCALQFAALPEQPPKPRNPLPAYIPTVPVAAETEPEHHAHHPHGLLIAVALLPLGMPLLWLTATAVAGKQSVFSFVAPVAIALGIGGLCVGIATVHRWSFAARIRAMLAVVLLGYACAGVLYFTKPTWIETARKLVQVFRIFIGGFGGRTEYRPKDGAYSVRFPGPPTILEKTPEGNSPLKGDWRLNDVATFSDPRRVGPEVFVAAHGFPPENYPLLPSDDKLFGDAKAELLNTTGGKLLNEAVIPHGEATIREYEVLLPDGLTKRFVRIVRLSRLSNRVCYLAVEGPFISADTLQVHEFMRSFKLLKK